MSAFKDHFSTLAQSYAQFRPRYPEALFEYLAGLCETKSCAWDCACGSGQATSALAQYFEQIEATDASAEQIAAATPHPRVHYRVAPAEASGLTPESIDLITVAQALHWFDIERFYSHAKQVLKSNGVLAVWTYNIQRVDDPAIDAIVQTFYHDVVGPYWPPERRLVETGYRELPFPFDELTPPSFEMSEHWSLPHLLGYLSSWSATGRYRTHRGIDPIVALDQQLLPLWGDPQATKLIRWPLSLRVGRKTL